MLSIPRHQSYATRWAYPFDFSRWVQSWQPWCFLLMTKSVVATNHSFTLFFALVSQKNDYDRSIGGMIHSTFSGFSWISYTCRLHESKPFEWIYKVFNIVGAKEEVQQRRYVKKQPLLQKLWIFVFEELQRKSKHVSVAEDIQRICYSRGEWVINALLQEGKLDEDDLNKLWPYVDSSNFTFNQCLIVWHIATDLLFYEAEDERQKEKADLKKRSDDDEIETRNMVSKMLGEKEYWK
ncbi:hypothetical protein Fmac_030106 [Flemingia macrophylla]|uniref:Uncharacterized protein n=1 Tax=Flemingia macrophylla TaxID=520843 RepID=A0ABD1LC90_9FABA